MSSTREEEEAFFSGGWKDDDDRIDVYALFVLEDMPVAEIEDAFRTQEDSGSECLWLADNYNNLPDFELDKPGVSASTELPLDPNWQSPFRGQTVQDAAEFLRNVPKPRKPLCKTYFAILDKARYREQGQILVCKMMEDGQVESIPCKATCIGIFFGGHDRDTWAESRMDWEEDGMVLMA